MTGNPQVPPHTDTSLDHLREVGRHNHDALNSAAHRVLETVRSDGLVFTAGAGHSLGAVLETFYRAGGLACVRPLYHPDLLPLHGAVTSTGTERTEGLAETVLTEAGLAGNEDSLVIFSNSGINPYPVRLAQLASAAGSPVIAVTSRAAGAAAPKRAGSTLAEHADIVLDTLVPAGDTGYPIEEPITAPYSSLANAFLWNMLLVRIYELAGAEGLELPWWRSANTVGGDEANAANLQRYGHRVPRLN